MLVGSLAVVREEASAIGVVVGRHRWILRLLNLQMRYPEGCGRIRLPPLRLAAIPCEKKRPHRHCGRKRKVLCRVPWPMPAIAVCRD